MEIFGEYWITEGDNSEVVLMAWTEWTTFMYFLGGVLPGVSAISRGGIYWTIVGIAWAILIFGIFYWRTR